MAECNLEQIIKSCVDNALNKPIMNGKSITQWAAIGMKAPQWVSVEERLPEEDTDVLVWNHLGIEIAAYTTNPVKRWYSYNGQEVIAIYWMPMPELPNGGHE